MWVCLTQVVLKVWTTRTVTKAWHALTSAGFVTEQPPNCRTWAWVSQAAVSDLLLGIPTLRILKRFALRARCLKSGGGASWVVCVHVNVGLEMSAEPGLGLSIQTHTHMARVEPGRGTEGENEPPGEPRWPPLSGAPRRTYLWLNLFRRTRALPRLLEPAGRSTDHTPRTEA